MTVLPKSNSEQLLSSLTRLSSITAGMGSTSTGISSAEFSTINSGAEPTMSNTLTDNNNVGGHPKGTMAAYSIDLQKQIVLIKNEAAEAFSDVRCHAKCHGACLLQSFRGQKKSKISLPKTSFQLKPLGHGQSKECAK